MDPQTGKWLWAVLGIAGTILAAVSTVMFNHYRDKASSGSAQARHAEVIDAVTKFASGTATALPTSPPASPAPLAPAATTTTTLPTPAPVELTADYRPLTAARREALVNEVKEVVTPIAKQRNLKVKLLLQVYGGVQPGQQLLLEDIRQVLNESGVDATIFGPHVFIGGNVGNPVAIGFNPANADIATALARVLQPLIGRPFVGTRADKFDPAELVLKISGTPRFRPDGTVVIS